MKNNTYINPGITEDLIVLKVHWLLWLTGTAIHLKPLIWHYPQLSFQVSPTSEVKTDSGTFPMTELEPQQCIQSNASAAMKEDWHWRKGQCTPSNFLYDSLLFILQKNTKDWWLTFPVFQAGEGTEQNQQQKSSENSTSTSSVQQATESHVHMEPDCQPHQSAFRPCVLLTSYGRTTCPHKETKKGAWKREGKG